MSKIRESIKNGFENNEIERIDKNIDSIKVSLMESNQKFTRYTLLIFISLFSYQLVFMGELSEVSILGIKLSNKDAILKWFLIIPSILLLLQSLIGYLRVYQQESIEYLLAIHRNKEYLSGLYRVAYPANHILALDLMRRTKTNISTKTLNILTNTMALFTISAPSIYIGVMYIQCFIVYGFEWQIIISSIISLTLIWQSGITISRSQEI